MAIPNAQSLRQVLVAQGCATNDEVRWFIFCQVFPLRLRLWRHIRLRLGGEPGACPHIVEFGGKSFCRALLLSDRRERSD